jgi:DNA-binding MarR family transcriptional regulator
VEIFTLRIVAACPKLVPFPVPFRTRYFFLKDCRVSTVFKSLELWRRTLVSSVSGDAPDLSSRQMALLLSVYMVDQPHTVRGLASTLKISKPAVSRALDRLGELGYIRRERDEMDRRNVLVQRTPTGASYLNDYAALIAQASLSVSGLQDREVNFTSAQQPQTTAHAPETGLWAGAAA